MPVMCHRLHFSLRLTVRALRGRRRWGCKFSMPKVRPTLKGGHSNRNELVRNEDARKCRRRGQIRRKEVRGELGKQENKKEEICEVERKRVGEAFFLVNKGLRHVSHKIFFLFSSPFSLSFLTHCSLSPSLTLSFCLSLSHSYSPSLARFLSLLLTQTWFVDLVVRGLENGSWLKQECVIPACNHTVIMRKTQMLLCTSARTHVQIYHTCMFPDCVCMDVFRACYSTHPAAKPYENNTAYHFCPPPTPSSHTDQQLVKC